MQGDRARSQLASTRFADLRWVEETGSTNEDLLALAAQGAPEGTVIVADHQTAGRGRLDRTWDAPPASSLLMSVLLRPKVDPAHTFLLTAAVGVAAAQACSGVAGVFPELKWPNDLVIVAGGRFEGRKVGGILAEAGVEGHELTAVVVGMGLNVNWPAELPLELADIAVGLNHVAGRDIDREALLVDLLVHLDHWIDQLVSPEGRALLLTRYRELSATLGRDVRVTLPHESFEGEAVDITAQGHLLVAVEGESEAREVLAGDVVHLRHG